MSPTDVAAALARCTPLQIEFINAYIYGPRGVRYNLTSAARAVGYSPCSPRTVQAACACVLEPISGTAGACTWPPPAPPGRGIS